MQGRFFYNPTKGRITEEEAIEEMVNYMQEAPDRFYDIIVGCDSSSEKIPHFPVAVAILRVGEGGRFFLKKIRYKDSFNKRFSNWKNRIIQEVLLSCDLAINMRGKFEKRMKDMADKNFKFQFRYIHADISKNGGTGEMVKELTNLIRGNGFEPKIKPEAYIATSVADKFS